VVAGVNNKVAEVMVDFISLTGKDVEKVDIHRSSTTHNHFTRQRSTALRDEI
jgi:hypothetical protein